MRVYKESYKCDLYDVDVFGNPSFARITEHLLNVGSRHSALIGWGHEKLSKEYGICLVLIKNKIRMLNKMSVGMDIEVTTWPLPRVYPIITRYYVAKDMATGNVIWDACVECTLMNLTTRAIVNGEKFGLRFPDGDEEIPTTDIVSSKINVKERNELLARVPDAEHEIIAKYSDLDYNGHVNSARYVDFVTDSLDTDFFRNKKTTALEVQYELEVQPDTSINVKIYNIENGVFAIGFLGEKRCFEEKISF